MAPKIDISRRAAEMEASRLFLTGPRDSLGLFMPLATGSQSFLPISRPWWPSAGSVVAFRSSQTGPRNPHPTSGFRTALPELRWRSQTPRAAYGLPSDANYWFPEFSAGRKAFGGALAG